MSLKFSNLWALLIIIGNLFFIFPILPNHWLLWHAKMSFLVGHKNNSKRLMRLNAYCVMHQCWRYLMGTFQHVWFAMLVILQSVQCLSSSTVPVPGIQLSLWASRSALQSVIILQLIANLLRSGFHWKSGSIFWRIESLLFIQTTPRWPTYSPAATCLEEMHVGLNSWANLSLRCYTCGVIVMLPIIWVRSHHPQLLS